MADARPVICATEDSEASRHAVRAATWLAGGLDAPLVLAHVFDPLGIGTFAREEMLRRRITDEDLEQSARVAARRLLDDTAGAVTGAELETKLEEGQPVPELRRLATERRATLLVAGAAARGGLDRILIGSVAGRLAAVAPCPLVVVPRSAGERPHPG
jgi:nucleotide-binding universal stress UspA family protein